MQTSFDKKLEPQLVIYPSYAVESSLGFWKVELAGYAFQQGDVTFRKRLLIRLLQRAMKVDPEELASELFHQRIQPFIAHGEKGQKVVLQFGDQRIEVKKPTKRNGHFRTSFQISADEFESAKAAGYIKNGYLKIAAKFLNSEAPATVGRVELIPRGGISIISDIDDTIKVTDVGNLSNLLTNTFLREFEKIEGMPDVYRQWADLGARFHYVSSSPWQLFEPLVNLQIEAGFPKGSMHLRDFKLRDQMLGRMRRPQYRGKGAVIQLLLRHMPHRKFILIGDSGEKDPEIYHRICLRYPEQVCGLFIRQVQRKPMVPDREKKTANKLLTTEFGVFNTPEKLDELATNIVRQHQVGI